jgi:hypothetical protein
MVVFLRMEVVGVVVRRMCVGGSHTCARLWSTCHTRNWGVVGWLGTWLLPGRPQPGQGN